MEGRLIFISSVEHVVGLRGKQEWRLKIFKKDGRQCGWHKEVDGREELEQELYARRITLRDQARCRYGGILRLKWKRE